MYHRSLALRVGAVALAFAVAGDSLAGQPATFRHTTGFSVLHSLNAGPVAEGAPGYRVSAAWGWTPRVAFETSLMQVGGDDLVFRGGGLGVRLSHYAGPLRLRPAAELVAGQAIVDEGGWWIEEPGGGLTYRPYRRPASTPSAGVGALVNGEWFHRSGWGADVLVGYWRLFVGEPGGALVVAAGPRRAKRDAPWYWRTSGLDDAPPRLEVLGPEPRPDGLRDLGADGLTLLAADRSGIAGIAVDGVPVALRPAPADAAEVPGQRAAAAVGTIRPPIHSGRHPLQVEVRDGAGNAASRVVWVTSRPVAPPALVVTAPAADVLLTRPFTDVTGVVLTARSDIRVEVNGCVAEVSPVILDETSAHGFGVRVPLDLGSNPVEVRFTDRLGGLTVVRRDVVYEAGASVPVGAAPALTHTASPAASGRAVRVQGQARDPGDVGIRDVRVAGEPAALGFGWARRIQADFVAYIPATPGQRVDVEAHAFDGRSATGTFTADRRRGTPLAGAALLIGIESYAADRIAGPTGAATAARALSDLLTERGAAVMPSDRVRVLTDADATAEGIRAAMGWLARASRDADVVFVYLAGRAVTSAAGEAMGVVPHDVGATYGPGSIPWAELDELFRSIRAEVVVVAELAADEGDAAPPPLDPPCGVRPLPAGGLAVVAASGPADGSFSRRALDALAGGGRAGGTAILLADLLDALGARAGDASALRTRGPVFDPFLPLTMVHHER
jgi:hypothetical protein